MVTAINLLFSIINEPKPYIDEHLLSSMEDLNDMMLESQNHYYEKKN